MWTKLSDCRKQLTIFSRLRESEGDHYNLYKVTAVEFDQYKLELTGIDNGPSPGKLEQILNCQQLLEYGFELEQPSSSLPS